MKKDNHIVSKKILKNLTIYDPDKLPYDKQYLCVYLRELIDEAEKDINNESL